MKTNKIFIIPLMAVASVLGLQGCKEVSLPNFDTDTHYLHFKDASDKEVRFSFATHPGIDEYTLSIPVTMIGLALNEDAQYNVSVVRDGELATTASDETFTIVNSVFTKEVYEDNLEIKIFKKPELSEEKRITVRIENSNEFMQGPVDYITKVIYITNVISRPEWWDEEFSNVFLGSYSDIKYENFIIVTGVSDLKDMSVELISSYVRTYVYYLRNLDEQGTPLYEEDGVTKVLASITFTNV